MRMAVLLATLVVLPVVAGCAGVGGPPVAGGGVIPPTGTIWFGSGVTGHDTGTISGLIGQSDSIPMSNHIWFIGHLTQAPPDGTVSFEVNGCPEASLTCPGQLLPEMTFPATSGGDQFEYGVIPSSSIQAPLAYSLTILSSGGAQLASGTVTITP